LIYRRLRHLSIINQSTVNSVDKNRKFLIQYKGTDFFLRRIKAGKRGSGGAGKFVSGNTGTLEQKYSRI
jgi:hypothetical protein